MKAICKLITALLLASTVQAQESLYYAQAIAGPTVTDIGSSSAQIKEPLVGSRYGAQFEFQLNTRFSLVSGVFGDEKGYTQQLTAADETGAIIDETTSRTFLNFATAHLGIRHYMEEQRGIYFEAGLNGSLLTKARNTVESTEFFSGTDSNIKDQYKALDMGVVIGLGYARRLKGPIRLSVGFQHHIGLLDLDASSTSEGRATSKLSTMLIGIGVELGDPTKRQENRKNQPLH